MSHTLKNLLAQMLPFLFRDNGQTLHKENIKWTILLLSTLAISWWAYERSNTVAISDARIASNVIIISSNRSGWISEFAVNGGQQVNAGDLLVQIDDRAAKLAIEEMQIQILTKKAEIERSHSERAMVSEEQASLLETEKAKLESARSNANKANSSLQLAQSNFERTDKLLKKQLVSKRQWEEDELILSQAQENHQQAKSELLQQSAELRKAKAQMMSVELLERKIAIMEQDLERLRVKQKQFSLDVDDRQIRSPIDAIIDKTFGHKGEYISPGRRLLMLHNPEDIWINANIKETELRHVKPGMSASITVDAYPDHEFKAIVSSIDNATTSEFALLPNPNPSGNFTKVTQRLRIKLTIEQQQQLLKPGMMVEVDIDTRS